MPERHAFSTTSGTCARPPPAQPLRRHQIAAAALGLEHQEAPGIAGIVGPSRSATCAVAPRPKVPWPSKCRIWYGSPRLRRSIPPQGQPLQGRRPQHLQLYPAAHRLQPLQQRPGDHLVADIRRPAGRAITISTRNSSPGAGPSQQLAAASSVRSNAGSSSASGISRSGSFSNSQGSRRKPGERATSSSSASLPASDRRGDLACRCRTPPGTAPRPSRAGCSHLSTALLVDRKGRLQIVLQIPAQFLQFRAAERRDERHRRRHLGVLPARSLEQYPHVAARLLLQHKSVQHRPSPRAANREFGREILRAGRHCRPD